MVITQRETSPQLQLHGAGSLRRPPSLRMLEVRSNALQPCVPATTAECMHTSSSHVQSACNHPRAAHWQTPSSSVLVQVVVSASSPTISAISFCAGATEAFRMDAATAVDDMEDILAVDVRSLLDTAEGSPQQDTTASGIAAA